MARNIFVEELIHTPIEQQGTEIVERKGIGHPDSIADGLAEAVSRALCKMYVARFGRILHHNTDQVEVVGGQSAPKFGGGVFLEPAYILLVGRATTVVNGERLPYRTAAIEAAHDYLTQTCTNLNVDGDVTLDCKIGQGSVDLRGLYDTQKQLANDTSFGVGFAPFSELETVVLQTEQLINGPLKGDLKAVGQDIKVMGVRHGDAMRLTIAAAIVDKHVSDGDAYVGVIEELRERVLDNA
ncbi:MAG TPA: methionine adenosyltransferase, partial [Thermoplasmata archaeon]|nr:methionine adenosyltransferase [Thermoplasmata archaeon]